MNRIKSIALAVSLVSTGLAFGAQLDASQPNVSQPERSALSSFDQPHRLTRAEVKADLALWQRAGLTPGGEASPDPWDPVYQAKLARYSALRSSQAYADLVRQIAARTGEMVPGG